MYCSWLELLFFLFSFTKRNSFMQQKNLLQKNNHTIIHNLVRHSTEMKITSTAPKKKTPLGPCSQRVAASCVAREPQRQQQNINKYHQHHLLSHLGFPCWECDEELASQKPKSYHSWLREQFSCHKVVNVQKNAKPIWDLRQIYQKKQLRSFILLPYKKLMSPIPQLQNLELPILHPKSKKKRFAPRLSCANHIFPLTQRRQQASRLAVIQATKWWTTSQDQVDAAPLIFGTSGRSLFSLTHCKPMRKSISKIYVPTSGIFVWPLQTQLQNLKIAFRSWYQKKLC